MKNDSLRKVFSAIAVTAVAASATSVTAFADVTGKHTDSEIESASVKPVITATQKTLTLDEAKSLGKYTFTIDVSNANEEYCSTGMHIYYDDRLSLENGLRSIKKGDAGEELSQEKALDDDNAADCPAHAGNVSDPSVVAGMKGFFVTTAASANYGLDGTLWEVTVTFPDNLKAGDLFPIDIIYKSVGGVDDLFLDSDRLNTVMQSYAFTKGIYNAENLNTEYPLEGTEYDGYILIEPEAEETTTTTEEVTTTTTTTTTEAPTTTTTTTTETPTTTSTTTTAATTSTTATSSTSSASSTTNTTTSAETTTTTTTGSGDTTGDSSTTTTTTGKTTNTTSGKGSSSSSSKTSSASSSNKTSTSSASGSSPKTGVAGVGVAATGLAIAIGTAFILRKKED